MITLYQSGTGSSEFEIRDEIMPDSEWRTKLGYIRKLLEARRDFPALELLNRFPFKLYQGRNSFRDDFLVLCCHVALDEYVRLESEHMWAVNAELFGSIASTAQEVLKQYVRFVALEIVLDDGVTVRAPAPEQSARKSVQQALRDFESLLATQGAASAVDRIYTALHGFIRELCDEASIGYDKDPSITALFSKLSKSHPSLQGDEAQFTPSILRSISAIIDALGPIRNRQSMAHPNQNLLDEPEAHLVLNAAKTVFHYLDSKCKGEDNKPDLPTSRK